MPRRAHAHATRGRPRKPVRRSRAPESLLLRSAESLGRVIGALQRQLEETRLDMTSGDGPSPSRRRRKRTTSKKRTGK